MLTLKKGKDTTLELHDEDLGIHMFNATPQYGRGNYNVKHTEEAEKHFPGIGEHPDMRYETSLRDTNKDYVATSIGRSHEKILRNGGVVKYNYELKGIEDRPGRYGSERIQTHTVSDAKTG